MGTHLFSNRCFMQPNTPPPSGSDIAGSAIFKKFAEKAEGYIKQPTRMKQLLTDAYQKAHEKNDIGTFANEAWEAVQTLFRLIRASMSGEYTGIPGTTVVAAVAVLIYFMSPIDLIPDFIPVLGLLDDAALVVWFSGTLKGEMEKFHEWEATRPTLVESKEAEAPAARPNAATRHGHSDAAVPAAESAKNAGTTNSAAPAEPHGDVAAMTTDSSRMPNDGAADTGGNVR